MKPGAIGPAAQAQHAPETRPRRLSAMGFTRVLPALGALAIGLALWQALAQVVPPFMLPLPSRVWAAWLQLLFNGSLWRHVSATLSEALLGFGAAFVVGGCLAYPLARSTVLSSLMAPYIAATQAMPMIALAPLLVVWFGLGLSSKVVICALIVFFPILVNTVIGLRSIDREMLDAAKTLGAGRLQTLWYVEVPLSLRTLLGGVRMGLTLAITGAVVGEFVAADAGLGYLMVLARTNFDPAILFAAALTMAGLSILGYVLVGAVEHWLIDW